MPWNDPGETIIAGTGQAYAAAVGTALPTSESSSLNAAFHGLGYHTEDGVSVNFEPDIVEHQAWQSKHPIRVEKNAEAFTVSFVLLQWNEDTVPLAFGGGAITEPTSGHFKYTPPSESDAIAEKSFVIDVQDGSRIGRFVLPRAVVTESVEATFNRSEMAGLPISLKALQPSDLSSPWLFYSNDSAAFTTGS